MDYFNLTNGLECPHLEGCTTPLRLCRIQSTHCERKQWDDVLFGAGPDLLYHLARGYVITVHDQSERPRETRAMWQGLPWVRYMCEYYWGLDLSPVIATRGQNMLPYFVQMRRELHPSATNFVRHYKNYCTVDRLQITSCWRLVATPNADPAA